MKEEEKMEKSEDHKLFAMTPVVDDIETVLESKDKLKYYKTKTGVGLTIPILEKNRGPLK